jgi:hypothetical protein
MTTTPELETLTERLKGCRANANSALRDLERIDEKPIEWLEFLSDMSLLVWSANQAVDMAVIAARASGMTWEAIGIQIQMTKQGAQKRHAAAVRRIKEASK